MTLDGWRRWCPQAFHWYNHRHYHEALAHFTPREVWINLPAQELASDATQAATS